MIGYLIAFILGVVVTLYFTKPSFKEKVNKLIFSVTPKSKKEDKKDE
jgi:hypothetical protein